MKRWKKCAVCGRNFRNKFLFELRREPVSSLYWLSIAVTFSSLPLIVTNNFVFPFLALTLGVVLGCLSFYVNKIQVVEGDEG